MMEIASARDQVVEEELSDQEEVTTFDYLKRPVGAYTPEHVWLWIVEDLCERGRQRCKNACDHEKIR